MSESALVHSHLASPPELAEAVRSLTEISGNLLASYTALADRASRVDRELSAANAELARKLDELERLRAHLEAILHALPCGVVVRDPRGRIVRANAAAGAILGVDPRELVARGAHPDLQGERADDRSREIVAADGAVRVVVSRRSPIASGASVSPSTSATANTGSVEILDDRTELARMGERLHAHSKMAALGTLAGGIAHEIRNPLNAVQGFAKLLERELAPESKPHRFASRIVEGVREVDAIIANLLSFADPERLQLETVEPLELADTAIAAARAAPVAARASDFSASGAAPVAARASEVSTLGATDVDWRITRRVEAPPFVADRIKLRQALRNLVANALEAQPAGGSVDVDIRVLDRELVMTVCDSGPGVPAHLRQRITDPFFTTRAEGTGLGLALVHTIAALHGGSFEVSAEPAPSEHGGGARMVLRIPFNPA